jgi:predicted amidophosphoribosyltransferase
MLLIARQLGRKRRLPVDTSLQRITSTKQRAAGARQRTAQAKVAFACQRPLDPSLTYLLIDDVITTGATVKYAAQTLLDAGATAVWVASISRQPVD